MDQSTVVVSALLALFVLFITARGELGKYLTLIV